MNLRKLTNPLLRLNYWLFKYATKYLGTPEMQNELGLKAFHWLTPFIERSGYEWSLVNKGEGILIAKAAESLSAGQVVRVVGSPEYTPNFQRKPGGRVTKAMPRQLQKIKEGQEAKDA